MRGFALALLLDPLQQRQKVLSGDLTDRPVSNCRIQVGTQKPPVLFDGRRIERGIEIALVSPTIRVECSFCSSRS
jgi:hypothetical protein